LPFERDERAGAAESDDVSRFSIFASRMLHVGTRMVRLICDGAVSQSAASRTISKRDRALLSSIPRIGTFTSISVASSSRYSTSQRLLRGITVLAMTG